MALRPGNRTAHCWGAVGELALPHRSTGSGEAEGDFRQRMPGALLYVSPSGNRTVYCRGAVGL